MLYNVTYKNMKNPPACLPVIEQIIIVVAIKGLFMLIIITNYKALSSHPVENFFYF